MNSSASNTTNIVCILAEMIFLDWNIKGDSTLPNIDGYPVSALNLTQEMFKRPFLKYNTVFFTFWLTCNAMWVL